MAYKGNELRSRIMQRHSGFPYGSHAPAESEKSRPVNGTLSAGQRASETQTHAGQDGIVTACCDLAFDAARAGGSREVMLVHLVHALSRVPEAAKILEAEGVAVAALRRDTAEIIFSDMPVGQSFGTPPSAASDDFATAMDLANYNRKRRGAQTTSVADLLVGVINGDQDALAVQLLRRHWPNWQDAVVPDLSAGLLSPGAPALQPGAASDAAGLETRLRAVENAFSSLLGEVAGDRNSFGLLLREMQDTLTSHRADTNHLQAALTEQVKALELALDTHRLDVARVPADLLDRLSVFESSVEGKINEAMKVWQSLGGRLRNLEQTFESGEGGNGQLPATLLDRLERVEHAIDQRLGDASKVWTSLANRLQQIEHKLDARAAADGEAPRELLDKLVTFERAIDVRLDKAAAAWGTVTERMAALEKSVSAETASEGHLQAVVSDRLQAVEKMLEGHRYDIANQLNASLPEQLRSLQKAVEARLAEVPAGLSGDVAEVARKVTALEMTLSEQRTEAEDIAKASEAQLAEVRSALGKLAISEKNLSGALDQWRLDATGDLGIISNRLETLEHMSVRPVELLEQLNVSMQAREQKARRSMALRERGFWRWLFGTPNTD